MRKKIESTVFLNDNKGISNLHESLVNTGAYLLTREPRTNQLTKDIIQVLNNHNLIDNEDDLVQIEIKIQS